MISMTWPQYRRRECTFRGGVVSLSPQDADVLLALLLRQPNETSIDVLIDVLWGDDPNGGPDTAYNGIAVVLSRLRAKLPGAIGGRFGWGWFIRKEITVADDTKAKLATLAEKLPETTKAAVLIVANDAGEVTVSGINTSVPQLLQMVGIATNRVGANLTSAPAKAA